MRPHFLFLLKIKNLFDELDQNSCEYYIDEIIRIIIPLFGLTKEITDRRVQLFFNNKI
jgi:hypothetical protein